MHADVRTTDRLEWKTIMKTSLPSPPLDAALPPSLSINNSAELSSAIIVTLSSNVAMGRNSKQPKLFSWSVHT